MATVNEIIEQYNALTKDITNLTVLIEGIGEVLLKEHIDLNLIDFEPVHAIWSTNSLAGKAATRLCVEAIKNSLISSRDSKLSERAAIEALLQPQA